MKVIALQGTVDTGKSHTINDVYSFLLEYGYTQIPGHFRALGNPAFEDFIDILTHAGNKVAIVGMGDYVIGAGGLPRLLAELDTNGCDVAICTCRTDKPKTVTAVTKYAPHHIVPKTLSTGRENDRIVNVVDALMLISLI